jgi:hypothetical protein
MDELLMLVRGNALPDVRETLRAVRQKYGVIPSSDRLFFEFLPELGKTYLKVPEDPWAQLLDPAQLPWLAGSTRIGRGFGQSLAAYPFPSDSQKDLEAEYFELLCRGNQLSRIESDLLLVEARVGTVPSREAIYFEYLPHELLTFARLEGTWWGEQLAARSLGFVVGGSATMIATNPENFVNQLCDGDFDDV